jgi:hypothetical protein
MTHPWKKVFRNLGWLVLWWGVFVWLTHAPTRPLSTAFLVMAWLSMAAILSAAFALLRQVWRGLGSLGTAPAPARRVPSQTRRVIFEEEVY